MKTSFFGKASNVAAGFPKFTASTSAGWPAIHWDRSTVWYVPELNTIRILAASGPIFSSEWPYPCGM